MFHFPALPSRVARIAARIESLHRHLTSLGAAEVSRPVAKPFTAVRAVSIWSEFHSGNIPHLKAELDCLDLRSKSLSHLPPEIRRSLARLREQVEWQEHLLSRRDA
jgi:hypothetical protein